MLITSLFTTPSFQRTEFHRKKQRDEQIRGEETKQKLDLWILLAPQNSLLWSFTSFSSFSEKFIYRSLLYRSLFCICWFIIFHLRTEQILCKQGKIETQTQEFRCSLFLRSTRGWRQQRKIWRWIQSEGSSRLADGMGTICRKICFWKVFLFPPTASSFVPLNAIFLVTSLFFPFFSTRTATAGANEKTKWNIYHRTEQAANRDGRLCVGVWRSSN